MRAPSRKPLLPLLVAACLLAPWPPVRAVAAPASGSYEWPVRGAVIRPFEGPASPYGAGHRGIDIAATPGTTVGASNGGVVAFAGAIAGARYVSIDHPDGIRTTYSWLSRVDVRAGQTVAHGDPIGTTGMGHPGVDPTHLHFGARIGDVYIDPMLLLAPGSLVGIIRLAPLQERAN